MIARVRERLLFLLLVSLWGSVAIIWLPDNAEGFFGCVIGGAFAGYWGYRLDQWINPWSKPKRKKD